MIHVGLDAWNLPGDRRGIGRYVRAVLDAWATSFADRVRVSLVVPERCTWLVRQRYRAEVHRRPYGLVSRARHDRGKLDVLWFPFNGPSWTAFTLPAVATLHDASTFVLPGFDEAARATFRAAAARCAHILTDSEFSARELVRELPLAPERITAVPLGVAPPRPPRRPAVDPAAFGRFVLYVGGTEPRKGLATVIAALRRLSATHADIGLVAIGPVTYEVPAHDGVRIATLGFLDDDTLAAFFRACTAFVYVSSYEGFGLPILEAMSYGAPVIAAESSALPEAGGDAALYVPAGDDTALAAALARVWNEPALAVRLRERGLAQARSLPWTLTARRTLEVLERAAKPAR